MNNARNESTDKTLFFLNYGRHPVSPLTPATTPRHRNAAGVPIRLQQAATPIAGREAYEIPDALPAVTQYTTQVQDTLKQAKAHLEQARERYRRNTNRRRQDVAYSVGDSVLLQTKNISLKHPGTKKLLPRWLGPFKITQKIGQVAYRLDLPASMSRIHPVFHVSKLAEYKSNGTVQPPPPPVELEGELEYTVECILDKRIWKIRRKSYTEYLIKWTGYGHEHNSWEPMSNMANCSELVQEFENQYAVTNYPSGTRRSKRQRRR